MRNAECGVRGMLNGPTLIFFEDGPHFEEEVGLEEGFVRAAVRPRAEQSSCVPVPKPAGDLFDGGLFEIVRESGLASSGCGAGKNVAAGVGYAALVAPSAEA